MTSRIQQRQFADKVAIVTGGAAGIGRALCETLCQRGAHVIISDIDFGGARELAATLAAQGYRARAEYLDVSNAAAVQKLVADTVQRCGRLDYMFNNAAATAQRGELHELPLEPWLRAVDVNLLGVVHGTLAAYAQMRRQGFGRIVNIGSLAGLVGFPSSIPYAATKAAVVNLSLSLRMEAAGSGVNVSVACPGQVHGQMEQNVALIGVTRAAAQIIDGAQRNHAIIIFPGYARLLWWLHRLSPGLLMPIGRKLVADFRRRRLGTPAAALRQMPL